MAKKYGFVLELMIIDSFRRTTVDRRHRDAKLVQEIFRRCELAHARSCHTIDAGYYFKCPPAPFDRAMALQGQSIQNHTVDGVKIHDNPRLYDDLQAYLRDERPLEACHYCLGSCGRRFAHRQMRRNELHDAIGSYRHELEAAATIAAHNGDGDSRGDVT